MLAVSRDGTWLARLERIAERAGWPFEARAALPAPGRTPPTERALAVIDRALAGAAPQRGVSVLRALYPWSAVVLACEDADLSPGSMAATLSCGADEVLGKSLADAKLAARLGTLHDRALAAHARVSADGALMAERRAHRALLRARGKWKEISLDAGSFALLWKLLEAEGASISRDELGAALAAAVGGEREAGTVARRVLSLQKKLAGWGGKIVSSRGAYSLASAKRRP